LKVGLWPLVLSSIALVSVGAQITFRAPLTEMNLFSDDFSSYPVGSFPTPGGWQLKYPGAGPQVQTIVDAAATPKSLQLLGTYGNSALAKKDFATDATVIEFEVSVKTEVYGVGANTVAEVGFYNGDTNKYYPKIRFSENGTIWIEGEQLPLGQYVSQAWYQLTVTVDRASKSFSVLIGGSSVTIATKNRVFAGSDNPDEIRSFAVASGWAGVKVYFDNARVFDQALTVQPFLVSLAPWISFGALWGVVSLLFLRDITRTTGLTKLWSKRFGLRIAISLAGAFLITYFGARSVLPVSADAAFLGGFAAATLALAIFHYYGARKRD